MYSNVVRCIVDVGGVKWRRTVQRAINPRIEDDLEEEEEEEEGVVM